MGPTGRVLSVKVIECFEALSEECGRGRKSEPPAVSSGNLTPFGKGERAIEFGSLISSQCSSALPGVDTPMLPRLRIATKRKVLRAVRLKG